MGGLLDRFWGPSSHHELAGEINLCGVFPILSINLFISGFISVRKKSNLMGLKKVPEQLRIKCPIMLELLKLIPTLSFL